MAGGDRKSISATGSGKTSVPSQSAHFSLPVPVRSITLSKSNSIFLKFLQKVPRPLKRDGCADPDQAQFRRPAEAASNPAALLDIRTAAKYSLPVYSSLSIEKWGPPTFFFPHIQR